MTNETTAYEVAIFKNGQVVRVLGFTQRNTKNAVMGYCRTFGDAIMALLTDAEADADYAWDAHTRRVSFGSVSVGLTQRTKFQIENSMAA